MEAGSNTEDFSSLISDVYIYFAFRLHIIRPFPIVLSIKANCTPRPTTPFNYSKSHRVNWSKVSHSDIEKYNDMVSQSISSLPPEVVNCSLPHCTIHQDVLDSYSQYLVFTLLTSMLSYFLFFFFSKTCWLD